MSERPTTQPTPERLRQLKDGILENWQGLPPEHQATMTLVLLRRLVEGEYGPWTLSAIEMLWKEKSPLYSKSLPIPQLSYADLTHTNLTEEEIARLTEGDLRHITHEIAEHYANDVFWEELEFVARLVLAERGLGLPKEEDGIG